MSRTRSERVAAASADVTACTFEYQKALAELEAIQKAEEDARAPFREALAKAGSAVNVAKNALDIALKRLGGS